MAKQKRHDALSEMTDFSRMWQKYPILYDEKECNRMFAEDYKGTIQHIKQCYQDIATALNLSVADVKARRVKYRDSITKAVKQYSEDLQKGTCDLPTAAATKLSVFNWLLKFSCHYDASTMDGKNLDQCVEKILRGHANRQDRNKVDSSEVRSTLSCVSTYLRDAGKPCRLVLSVPKLWEVLENIAYKNNVMFLHNYLPMCVFEDDSVSCISWNSFSVLELPSSVCAWLSRNIDPTFNWVDAGMSHFRHHVNITLLPQDGKTPVVKRSDAMMNALNRAANVGKQARAAVKVARVSEEWYKNSIVYGFAVAGLASMSVSESCTCAQQQVDNMCLFLTDIGLVITHILQLESMRDRVCEVPALPVLYKRGLMRSLEAVRVNSKLYSSQFWNLPHYQ